MLASSQYAECGWDVVERERCDRGDGLDVAFADQLEEVGEDSVTAVSEVDQRTSK